MLEQVSMILYRVRRKRENRLWKIAQKKSLSLEETRRHLDIPLM